ncbi:MAG: sugar ABC transporter permease [Clostridia bacterium]|nr:sugar ABC transporter permease [Clostridia bacterium]
MNNAVGKRIAASKPRKDWTLLLMLLPVIAFIILFCYVPLAGWYLALIEYIPGKPILECEFVGLKNFRSLFANPAFFRALKNTLIYSSIKYVFLLLPPVFAILLNEINSKGYKRVVQTVTTLPHFISWVIIYGLCYALFSSEGPVNQVLAHFGTSQKLLTNKNAVYAFQSVLHLWKTLGWNAIIYLAAIAGIDQTLYEAAEIDGAGKFRQALHITVPGILPTMFVLLLLGIADLVSNGMDQYYVFQNSIVYNKLETLEMYTYKQGLKLQDYSYATAIGIFKSVISITLLFVTNYFAKKIRGESIV